MAERNKNWDKRDFIDFSTDVKLTLHSPIMGGTGTGVYQWYAVTSDKMQNSISLSEGGLMSIYNDGKIEIHAGKKSGGGVDIEIVTAGGDICLTADKTGQVRIRGSRIKIDCDGTLDMNVGKDLNIKVGGGLGISANVANLDAQTGNMLPEGESFKEKCFADSHVGSSAARSRNCSITQQFLGG